MTTTTNATKVPAAVVDSPISARARISGRIVSGVIAVLLTVDAVSKIAGVESVKQASAELGIPAHLTPVIGIVLLACLGLYLFSATAVLGAVLLTGYFGGAVLINMINEKPLFSTVLSGVYAGIIVWVGLYLRDSRVRALVPFGTR
ncbi:DoxX family protein [Antrihabitans cavernicola]|uniref:DoxX family protein n=1 Tax=Antrihabitans cavernicola TaxID=2495913 RepID=A0A5A7SB30_9NOCA|nr:DoxX family protein [Spelaeibacter cavernicola]KAA0021431.1 DoxX family protein [Spelaeibacter cavernicola]